MQITSSTMASQRPVPEMVLTLRWRPDHLALPKRSSIGIYL